MLIISLRKGNKTKLVDSALVDESLLLKSLNDHEYRRASRLSHFGIIKSSALSCPLLQHITVEQLQLSLDGDAGDLDEVIAKSISPSSKKFEVLTEEAVLATIWDRVFDAFFGPDSILQMEYEFEMGKLHENYKKKRFVVDRVVGIKLSDGGFLPLLHIEVAKVPVNCLLMAHKDERKIACLMAQSLLATIGVAKKDYRPSELEKLRIFGLLIGGDEMEVVVMYPLIYEHSVDLKLKFDFIFQSKRNSWRFNLFCDPPESGEDEETSEIQDVPASKSTHFEQSAAAFNARRANGAPNPQCFGALHQVINGLHVQADKLKNLKLSDAYIYPVNFVLDLTSGRNSHHSASPRKNDNLLLDTRFDPSSVLSDSDSESEIFMQFDSSDSFNEDSYSDEEDDNFARFNEGSRGSDSSSDKNDSNSAASSSSKRLKIKNDDSQTDSTTFEITKRHFGHELDVYCLQAVKASLCFPKLFRHEISEDGSSIFMVLERLLPFTQEVSKEELSGVLQAQSFAAQVLVDCVEGLRILHGAQVVHGDVSPNNLGFNQTLDRWQLFDFNQSRNFTVAKEQIYRGGTSRFRSRAYRSTGLFFPIDDYVALFNSCTLQLRHRYGKARFLQPFEKLQTILFAHVDREQADLDAIYAEAVTIFRSLKLKLEADKNGTNFEEKENIQQNL